MKGINNMCACEKCLYNKNCQYLLTHKTAPDECTAFKSSEDFVEVVRCRDCRFSKPAVNNDYIVCEIMECYCGLMKDDFCVCGKRREENAVD